MKPAMVAFGCLLTMSAPCLAAVPLQPGGGSFGTFSHHDQGSVSISIGVVLTLGQNNNPFVGSTAAFSGIVGHIPYERRDEWNVSLPITAEIGLFDWYVSRGIVTGSQTPLTVQAELNVQPGDDNPADLGFVKPEAGLGIELRFPWEKTPELELYTELRVGLDLDWYQIKLPALTYSWDTVEGRQFRTLGMDLNLFAPGGSCMEASEGVAKCPFDAGEFRLTGGIPEPTTWSMLILGFGLIGASLRARAVPQRPKPGALT